MQENWLSALITTFWMKPQDLLIKDQTIIVMDMRKIQRFKVSSRIYVIIQLGILVPPSQICLLINDNGSIMALYSTDDGAHLSFIGRYMCDGAVCIIYQ